MPNYKLHYFNIKGRGETIRMIFAAAGQKFEDYRIEFPDWPNKKKDYKFGKLPVLEIDGEKLNQSVAISHYLALQFGLAGKTPLDAAKCHALVETAHDFVAPFAEKLTRAEPQKRPQIIQELEKEVIANLAAFEDLAKSCNGGFLFGQMTYADLEVFNTVSMVTGWYPGALKSYPNLQKHYDLVSNLPKLKEYLAKRPQTMM